MNTLLKLQHVFIVFIISSVDQVCTQEKPCVYHACACYYASFGSSARVQCEGKGLSRLPALDESISSEVCTLIYPTTISLPLETTNCPQICLNIFSAYVTVSPLRSRFQRLCRHAYVTSHRLQPSDVTSPGLR